MFKKILYIGAGTDLLPLDIFPSSNFVYIDSLPRNSYGYPYYYRGFYDRNFKQKVMSTIEAMSFYKTSEKIFSDLYSEINVANLDSHCVSFYRDKNGQNNQNGQNINYYFSTGIPENIYDGTGNLNTDLCADIAECDTIMIKGHWPYKDVFKYMKTPIHFIGNEMTHFPENKMEILDTDIEILSFSYLNASNKLYTFSTYDEFYKKVNEHPFL
jgi:hypothetical protein